MVDATGRTGEVVALEEDIDHAPSQLGGEVEGNEDARGRHQNEAAIGLISQITKNIELVAKSAAVAALDQGQGLIDEEDLDTAIADSGEYGAAQGALGRSVSPAARDGRVEQRGPIYLFLGQRIVQDVQARDEEVTPRESPSGRIGSGNDRGTQRPRVVENRAIELMGEVSDESALSDPGRAERQHQLAGTESLAQPRLGRLKKGVTEKMRTDGGMGSLQLRENRWVR